MTLLLRQKKPYKRMILPLVNIHSVQSGGISKILTQYIIFDIFHAGKGDGIKKIRKNFQQDNNPFAKGGPYEVYFSCHLRYH
mgnify:CR=1 FL=1